MKLELYKAYKTRAGHKAVVVEATKDGQFGAWHEDSRAIWWHEPNGDIRNYKSSHPNTIEKEWQEPRTFEVYVDVYSFPSKLAFETGCLVDANIGESPRKPCGWKVIARKKITITEGEGL